MARTLGIIGAGKLGMAVGKAAADGGWNVIFNDVADPISVEMMLKNMIPQAKMSTCAGLANQADVVMLALPISQSGKLNYELLDDAIVLDAMNDWAPEGLEVASGTSETVAERNPKMHIAKSINHLSYHDYSSGPRPKGAPDRRAMVVATDFPDAAEVISELVDDMGFDPVVTPFANNRMLEMGGPIFGVRLSEAEMREILAT